MSAPVETEPAVGSLPDQAPDAWQAVAPVVLQARVLAAPVMIDAGVADNEIVGGTEAGAEKMTSSTYRVRHELAAASVSVSAWSPAAQDDVDAV